MRIETSSIEVGSSAINTAGRTASARAIATRWRCPPDSSCGYFAATAAGGMSPTVSSNAWMRPSSSLARDHVVDLRAAGPGGDAPS